MDHITYYPFDESTDVGLANHINQLTDGVNSMVGAMTTTAAAGDVDVNEQTGVITGPDNLFLGCLLYTSPSPRD